MRLLLTQVIAWLFVSLGTLTAQSPNPDQQIEVIRANIKSSQVIPSTPEAAELGKYGNTPVNLSTGAVNINIPLYELKGNDISLPISISFNASGYKPQDRPTWVGQGWSLNAAGVITRSVRGNPDDSHYFGHPEPLPAYETADYMEYLLNVRKGVIESQPDLYYYNFNNNSGKFGLSTGNIPDVIKAEDNMIKIAASTSGLEYFTAKDLNGISYKFDQREMATLLYDVDYEGSGDQAVVRSFNYPSSWFVSSMTSANGREEIRFEYYSTSPYEMNLHQRPSTGASATYTTTVYTTGSGGVNYVNSTSSTIYASPTQTMTSTRKFLKKISLYRDSVQVAYVDFISGSREDAMFSEDRMLTGIRVYSTVTGQEQLIKSYDFKYRYYVNPNQTYDNKRLRLDTLQELPVVSGTVAPKPYSFEYYGGSLPDTYTYDLDHWGFYNNTSNASIVPKITYNPPHSEALGNTVGQGANREPKLDGSIFAMLSKINYPTGGYTTFEYELHNSFNPANNSTRNIGGIRIAKMVDYSGNNQVATTKRYRYVNVNGTSSGVSDNAFPKYLTQSSWRRVTNLPLPAEGSRVESTTSFNVTGNAVYGLASFPGGHVGYTRVEEITDNAQSGQGSYTTVYEYTFNTPNRFREDIANGDLIRKSVYDNGGLLLKQTTNKYTYPSGDYLDAIEVKPLESQTSQTSYCFQSTSSPFIAYDPQDSPKPTGCVRTATYNLRYTSLFYTTLTSQQRLLTNTVTRTYDKKTGKYLVDSTANEYRNNLHIFPVKITQYTGGNDQLVTQRKYIGDGLGTASEGGYNGLYKSNQLSAEIESYQYREDTLHQQQRVIGGRITYYGTDNKPIRIFQLEIATPLALASYTPLSVSNNSLTKDARYKPVIDFYYNNGNLVTQQKINDIAKSYTWDYNGTQPTAEVLNADSSVIAYASFESAISGNIGGWRLTNVSRNTSEAYTGIYSGSLSTGSSIVKNFSPASNKVLIVSFWSKNGSVTVTNNAGSISPAITGNVRNGWSYGEYKIPVNTTQISINGNALIDELRCYPADAQMNTYTYKPFVGISSITSPTNQTVKFEYDGLNRLVTKRDEKNNILERMSYAYGTNNDMAAAPVTLFYNNLTQGSFTRNTPCPTGAEPSTEIYVVPYGKYVSYISQQDADVQAQQDVNANGQQYANTVGTCWYYNVQARQFFPKTTCGDSLLRGSFYTVPARTYKSSVSQAAADAMAQADLQANGPAYAESHTPCPCDNLGEGYKLINGECVKGYKLYLGSAPRPGGGYTCTYRYEFPDGTHSQNYTEYSSQICNSL